MVRRRTTERFGIRHTALVTLARTRLIYISHVLITLLALLVGTYMAGGNTVTADTYGWPLSILRTLVLALNPPLSILGLWVALLLIAVGALYLMGRGYVWLMLSLSFAAYAFGKAVPFGTGLPGQGELQAFQVEAWQFLFCLGLAIGWSWRTERLQLFITSRATVLWSAALIFVLTGLAHFTIRAEAFTGALDTLLRGAFNKLDLGPGAIVFSLAVALVVYTAASWAGRTRLAPSLKPIRLLGSYSLGAYVISTIAAIILPAVLQYDKTSRFAELLALAVILICWVWAYTKKPKNSGHQDQLSVPAGR